MKDINENTIPKNVDMDNGIVEKLTIASIEYLNKLQNDQLVSPTALSMFSYSIHFVLNPTHSNNPFEKRLYSSNSKIESITCLVINL